MNGAFPSQSLGSDGLPICEADPGMTLRDWFAGQALVGLMTNSVHDHCPLFGDGLPFARDAYAVADAMLAERAKPTKAAAESAMQHVAYFDEGEFHWTSGIAPRDCELFAKTGGPA